MATTIGQTPIKGETVDTEVVLNTIQSLRNFTGPRDAFVAQFLQGAAQLTKSPIALYISQKNDKEWVIEGQYGFAETHKEALKECINLALPLSGRVIQNGFSYEKITVDWLLFGQQTALAVKIKDTLTTQHSFFYLIIEQHNAQQLSEMMIRMMMIADIPASYGSVLEKESVSTVPSKILNPSQSVSTDVLEVLSGVIHQEKFLLASMLLVNELATRFNCSQVSIGWLKGDYVTPIAISHIEKFDKHTDQIHALEALYEESADQDEEIVYPIEMASETITFAHQNYWKQSAIKQLISLPLRLNNNIVGVVVCERGEDNFSDDEMIAMRLICNHTTAWLNELNQKDRWIGGRIALKSRKTLSSFLGVKHTFVKLLSVILSILLLISIFGNWEYKIEATGNLETDNISFLSAPFNGFVQDVKVHAGDKVAKDDTLLIYDREELYLKETEINADINKYKSESEKARARASLADMRVALAKKEQSEASLERVRYHLRKSVIKSPFDGIIIQGDKEDLLGSPITTGDLLFKVAKPLGLYLKFKIQESDIDEIAVGDEGKFALLSSPDTYYQFKIEKIIPIAEIDQTNGNIFIVKAIITSPAEEWWRPGMSSVSKVEVGQRNIMWILTHKLTDFLRIYFWI